MTLPALDPKDMGAAFTVAALISAYDLLASDNRLADDGIRGNGEGGHVLGSLCLAHI